MKVVFFTKLFKSYSPDELIEFAAAQGLDGFDLAVRPEYPINQDNIATELVPFSKKAADSGLSIELATIGMRPLDLTDPSTEAAWAACAEAGVPRIKLGYAVWEKARPWKDQYDEFRRYVEGCCELSLKHGPKSVIHTHSGPYVGINASSVRHLLDGMDPKGVGAYLDFAHLAADGEPPDLAIATSGEYLAMVAAKNMRYVAHDGSPAYCVQPGSHWKPDWCTLADGIVSWSHVIAELREAGYDGAISLHGEYTDRHSLESVLDVFVKDVEFMKGLVSAD